MSLVEKGYEVDIIATTKDKKKPDRVSARGIHPYLLQHRSDREVNAFLYFSRLGWFMIKAALLLTFLSLRKRYAVVHITSPPDPLVFEALIPKLTGARVLLDIHDIGPELFERKLKIPEGGLCVRVLAFLEKISAGYADHVLTVTDLWRDKLVARSVRRNKCSVLLNVPDNHVFQYQECHVKPRGQNLFYHGSLEEHFGVDTLIQAVPMIRRNTDCHLSHASSLLLLP
jgi:glycosyltransferase involved in cell wall biosynthesis